MGEDLAARLRLCVRRTPAATGVAAALSVELRVPADLRCVEEAVELMVRHCFAGLDPTQRTRFRLRVLLSEALTNGILFGAGGDPARNLQVTADGPGFDPAEVPDPTSPPAVRRPIGRGLFLIRSLADRVEFNAQGNTIWMTLPRS